MIGRLIGPELEEMIEARAFHDLRDVLIEFPVADIAEILGDLDADRQAILFRILPSDLAAEVFDHLDVENQRRLLRALGTEQVAQILNDLPPDDRTNILEELPAQMTQQLLTLLSPDEQRIARTLLGFPEDSIGRRMTPEYVSIQRHWSIAEVLAHLRRVGRDRETLNQLFVIDAQGHLEGEVRLRDLVVHELNQPVADLIEPPQCVLRATDDQESAVAAFKKYDRTTLPVVDSRNLLAGVVTVDDVLDLAEEEATEDIHKSVGIQPLVGSLLHARFSDLYSRRIGWLVLLVFVNLLSGAGIALHEGLIESVVALVFFLPLLIGSGGNAGAQAATLVVRGLALGEVRTRDYPRLALREMMVSLLLGLSMAWAVFLLGWWRSGPAVAWAVSLAMVSIVFIASLVGMTLPFILNRLRLDPATASAPLVTSLADIFGVLIYFAIAKAILGLSHPPPVVG
ncbi:MAG: magnesium transporter [Verrucomicrobiae bacterium]|nr:magnesium transporter [Verrucomicrobiae bacterium]